MMTWQSKPTMQVNTFVRGYGWEFNKLVILVNEKPRRPPRSWRAYQGFGLDVVGTRRYGKVRTADIKLSDSNNAIISTSEMMLPTTAI